MRARIFKRGSVIAALAVATVLPMLISPATASAGGDTSGSHVVSNTKTGDRKVTISVFSPPAMDRNIPLEVILPADGSEPPPDALPAQRCRRRRRLGDLATQDRRHELLPGQERQRRHSTRRRVQLLHRLGERRSGSRSPEVADVPHQGTPARHRRRVQHQQGPVDLRDLHDRDLGPQPRHRGSRPLQGVGGAYSGCAETSTPVGQSAIELVTGTRGGADITNMWGGPLDGQAGRTTIRSSTPRSSAAPNSTSPPAPDSPGPHDTLANPAINGQVGALANQAIVGGVIEQRSTTAPTTSPTA